MKKCVNKKLTALFLAAVMGGSLCVDMTTFAEEVTDQEVIISETEEQEDTVSEEEDQIAAEPESDESEKPLEELPETTPNEEVGNVQVETENNELEEKSLATQSNGISLQSIEGVCGENLTWSLDETTGTLTISGTGDMDDRAYYGYEFDYAYGNYSAGEWVEDEPWYENRDQIVKVVVGNGVTSIGRNTFAGMRKLKSIELSESITSIGSRAFCDCESLESIELPKSITSIGESAFCACRSLKSVEIPAGVTKIENYTFLECRSMENIEIPASVTSINERVFRNCNSLKNIVVAADNQNFASEDGILYNKSRNTLICYPEGRGDFSVPGHVSSIAPNAFHGCKNLSKITIPDSVTNIGAGAFFGCYSLKNVKLPNNLKKIEASVFRDCSLEEITIPDSVTCIEPEAFFGCNFKTVKIPDGVKEICSMAFEYSSLQSITISGSVTSIGSYAFYCNGGLKEVVLSEGLERIEYGAFLGCDELKSLTIPKSVSVIEEFAYGYENGHWVGGEKLNVKIKCYTNTAGHKYAKDNGISYELLDGKKITKVSKVSISGISKKIAAGKKIKLTAKVSPSKATNKSVKWTSSNKKVATVNSKGVVTINKKAGGKSVTITAAATDGSKKKATYKISVMKGVVKKVAISGNKSVKAGKTLKLKAKVTATKKANKTLKWTSSNKKYATVNSSGKVKTYKAGKGKKVKITAEATDGSGKKKTVTINIK